MDEAIRRQGHGKFVCIDEEADKGRSSFVRANHYSVHERRCLDGFCVGKNQSGLKQDGRLTPVRTFT